MRLKREINYENLDKNINTLKGIMEEGVKILAVVKGDAYGLGMVDVSKYLENKEDIAMFGVANIDDAVLLRKNGIAKDILIFGYLEKEEVSSLYEYDLIQTLSSKDELLGLGLREDKKLRVHIKIDTGLNRYGFKDNDMNLESITEIYENENISMEGIYSHLLSKSNIELSLKQQDRFDAFIKKLEDRGIDIKLKHLLNSSGLFSGKLKQYDMVRPGIGLYGAIEFKGVLDILEERNIEILDTLTIKSKVALVKEIDKGETISYEGSYEAPSKIRVAVIPIGYYDGYDRRCSGKSRAIINDRYCSSVGYICMNAMMFEVGDMDVKPGDEVVLLGASGDKEIKARELAYIIGTTGYDVQFKFRI